MMQRLNDLGTVIVGSGSKFPERVVRIGRITIEAEPDMPYPYTVKINAMGEERYIGCSELTQTAPQQWKGERWVDPDSLDEGEIAAAGQPVLIRPTVPDDAVDAVSAGYPVALPLDVLEYMHDSPGGALMPDVYAMSEDDGFVATMMLASDSGLFVRYSGAWHKLVDDDVVDGLNATQVDPTAIDVFDQYDIAGQLAPLQSMTGPTPVNLPPIADETPADESVTASVESVAVPPLTSAAELDAALQYGAEHPEVQWWIERRVATLGLGDVQYPW